MGGKRNATQKAFFRTEKAPTKAAAEQQIVDCVLEGVICQALGFAEYTADFQKEIMVNSRFLGRGIRTELGNRNISLTCCFRPVGGIFLFESLGLIFPKWVYPASSGTSLNISHLQFCVTNAPSA